MKDKADQPKRYYQLLMRRMISIMIIVSFAPLILITGTVGYYFQRSYREKVIAQLKEMVEKHTQNIDSFLNEKLADIRVLSRSYSFEDLTNDAFLHERLSIRQREFGGVFVDLGVIASNGVQVAYAGPFKLETAHYSDAEWFKKAMQSDYFISDVFLGLRGSPHFIVAVKRQWKGQDWILRATIDFEAFNQLVKNIRIGKTGFAFILNRRGEFQTKPLVEVLPQREPYLDLVNTENVSAQSVVVAERANVLGRPCIYLMAPLKNGEWVLVCQQDVRDAFADLYHARILALVIFVIGGIGIVIMSVILSRGMVRRIAKADREKEMMNEQIIEAGKLASIGELAAGIAHEINNPVAIMVEEAGWIGDLLGDEDFQKGESLDEFKRALTQINTQGKRCKEITQKLLTFARKTDPRVHEIKVNELIEEIVAISEQRARYGNVKIEENLAANLPVLHISPSEFQQVLLNLINNALDAIDKDGGKIDISSRVDGKCVVIDVADTGHGIPKANLPRIFDPFFTTKPVGKGTGLGLFICYGIIKKMGGEISVNSAAGVGTTFHIRIPSQEGRASG
jgi:two-component system NtrC family sensor kinase